MANPLPILMIFGLLSLTPATATAEVPSERYARYALNNARLLGLSPAGAALWAEHILRTGDARAWRRITEIETLIARQLALESPDRRVLAKLSKDYAVESASLAQSRKQQTVSTAMQLSAKDRMMIGAHLVQTAQSKLRPATDPAYLAPAISSAVAGLFGSLGLSAQGTKTLVEAAGNVGEVPRTREKIQLAIGKQLTRDRPDRRVMNDLVKKYVTEEARLEHLNKEMEIENAFMLVPADRKRLGSFMAKNASASLSEGKPVLELVP